MQLQLTALLIFRSRGTRCCTCTHILKRTKGLTSVFIPIKYASLFASWCFFNLLALFLQKNNRVFLTFTYISTELTFVFSFYNTSLKSIDIVSYRTKNISIAIREKCSTYFWSMRLNRQRWPRGQWH